MANAFIVYSAYVRRNPIAIKYSAKVYKFFDFFMRAIYSSPFLQGCNWFKILAIVIFRFVCIVQEANWGDCKISENFHCTVTLLPYLIFRVDGIYGGTSEQTDPIVICAQLLP